MDDILWNEYENITYHQPPGKKPVCVYMFCFKKIPKLAPKLTFPPLLLKDWIVHYHSSNGKVFSPTLRLNWDSTAWK